MKLFGALLLLLSIQAFADESVKTSEGLISVHKLHCVINTRPVRTESTVLNESFADKINIIGVDPEIVQLDHKELKGEGCNEGLINEVIDDSFQSFGHSQVNVKVVTTIDEVRTNRHCFDLLSEELYVTFENGLNLKSTKVKRVEPENCN